MDIGHVMNGEYFGSDFEYEALGVLYAICNAIDEVKAVAEYLCDTKDNDEVAKLFEEILLSSPS